MYKKIGVFLLYGILLSVTLSGDTLSKRYPVYAYVFFEFDVDTSYIENEAFIHFVKVYEKRVKYLYWQAIQREPTLSSMVKIYLMEQGISDLFLSLAIVESGLSTDIVSPKRAVGLWQFMSATAKQYQLDVCNSFDERCDPLSSTHAAIRYLHALHQKFGKWYLAVLAYNCGEGRLAKAIGRAGSDRLEVLTDEKEKYLPKETREYIQKVLLVAMIGEGDTLDFPPLSDDEREKVIEVEVSAGCHLKKLAKILKMPPSKLLAMNQQFKSGIVPQKKAYYHLRIPEEKMVLFYFKYEALPQKKVPDSPFISYRVQMGDTLEAIAKKYHSSIEKIKLANHLEEDFLILDVTLLIPVSQHIFAKMFQSLSQDKQR